jgi:hypothetical protein
MSNDDKFITARDTNQAVEIAVTPRLQKAIEFLEGTNRYRWEEFLSWYIASVQDEIIEFTGYSEKGATNE